MKNLLILSLLLGFASSTSAQPYHKLIRTGASWDCSWAYDPYGGIGCATTINRIFFTGADTVLEGITYKISYAFPMHSEPPNDGKCPPYAVSPVSGDYQHYIREDTVARKVYIYYPIFWYPSDQVLYDFSLQPGDSLRSTYQGTEVVTSVDSVQIATGEYQKRFTLYRPTEGYRYYIEGIGGQQGLFTTLFTFESYGIFLCLKENGVSLWGNTCNSWFTDVPEQKEMKPVIFPNPSADMVTIDCNDSRGNLKIIEITGITGARLQEIRTTENRITLDIKSYPGGIYFVRIRTNNSLYSGKICKQ